LATTGGPSASHSAGIVWAATRKAEMLSARKPTNWRVFTTDPTYSPIEDCFPSSIISCGAALGK
jgi:hypothetical protein